MENMSYDDHQSDEWRFFRNEALRMGIFLDERMVEQFQIFYTLLIEKNKVMNLTAITELRDVIIKHFLDSLSLVNVYIPDDDLKVIDLGTGAGFPGIPLKIAFPETTFVLADSLQKRIHFLEECIKECGLEKIELVHGRAEDLGRDKIYREKFDLCVSRAVAHLSVLSEYCMPLVKTGGHFISYKSATAEKEIKEADRAVHLLGGKIEKNQTFTLPGTDMFRSLIDIQKIKATPSVYPRKAGTPAKEPL